MNKTTIITARQIKAARALLDWSQDNLAEASGLSIATIRKIEAGNTSPRGKTNAQLRQAFEDADIELIGTKGVQIRDDIITTIEGEDTYLQLLDDVFHTLKDTNDEVLVWYADNSVSPPEVIASEQRMKKNGISIRYLTEEDDTFIYSPLTEYRWVPSKYFRNNCINIYGSKVALSLYPNRTSQHSKKIVIIENAPLAEAMRNAFNFMWENCRKPSHTTAPEVFD